LGVIESRPLLVGIDARELQGKPTGAGRYLRNLLRIWTRDTSDRFVAYFSGPDPVDPALDPLRVRRRPLGPLTSAGDVDWQERLLPPAAEHDGLDVFFSPAYTCPLRLRIPRVTAVHDLSYFSYPQDFSFLHAWKRRFLVARSLHASRRILACSAFTRRELASRFPALADRVVHVPLGPDDDLPAPPSRDEARQRLGVTGPFVLTVGSLFNRRCLPELLRAVSLLRSHEHGHEGLKGIVLDVVGDNRTHPRLDLAGLVLRLGLGAHVRLSGFVDEAGLADRYAAADAAVFLSEYEGFGLPALEAASRGVPLVVSDRPSLSELFGEAALVVDPRNEGQIAEALRRILGDPMLRNRLVDHGWALASRHSWTRTAALTRLAFVAAARARS
jgi:glycosyltransferase involved in cell wall biosynthesis